MERNPNMTIMIEEESERVRRLRSCTHFLRKKSKSQSDVQMDLLKRNKQKKQI
jgi:hypothetical protein